MRKFFTINYKYPNIAQLVERPTVVASQLSGGPWFESGWTELFLPLACYALFLIELERDVTNCQ